MSPDDEEREIQQPAVADPPEDGQLTPSPYHPTNGQIRSSKDDRHARQKLAELTKRAKELRTVLAKKPQLEQEHANLAKEIETERMLVRERERSLAMELSTIDHELAESRSRLARLQGKEAALLQQVSAPLALETQWAKEAAESCGIYELVVMTLVSPRADLLTPGATEAVDLLPPGKRVNVTESLRLPDGAVRARISEPSGWIFLLDQAGTRCAVCKEVDGVSEQGISTSCLIDNGITSRSAALRGWTARVDVQKSIFAESLRECFRKAAMADASTVGPYMLQPLTVTPLARHLSTEAISRTTSSKAAEANSDLARLDAERAAMEMADAESAVTSLFYKLRAASSRNKVLVVVISRLHSFLHKAKSAAEEGRPTFGLMEHWEAHERGTGIQLEDPEAGCTVHELRWENLPPPAAAASLSEEVDACEEEAQEAQVRIDTMLRSVMELQRQRGERMQEISDLRQKLFVLRSASSVTMSGRQLKAVQSRLRRIQDIVAKMANGALEEIQNVEAWIRLVEDTRAEVAAGLLAEDSTKRSTEQEVHAVLQDLQSQFRPGQAEDGSSTLPGAQSAWWLAANIAALSAYAQVEAAELGPATEVDKRREFYALADSRFAKEMRHYDDW